MALFVNPRRVVRYVPRECSALPAEKQAWFELRPLSAEEYERRTDFVRDTNDKGKTVALLGSWRLWTLRRGITNAGGHECPAFLKDEEGLVADSFLDHLSPNLRSELALEIERISNLDANDLKG